MKYQNLKTSGILALILALTFIIQSCTSTVDLEREKEALLSLNDLQRTAHMQSNAAMLTSQIADSLVSVDRGNISIVSNAQVLDRFTSYFKTVSYHKWDDMQKPVIDISPQGNYATVSVQKLTISESKNGTMDTTTFAWTAAYKKIQGDWKMYSMTSTDNR